MVDLTRVYRRCKGLKTPTEALIEQRLIAVENAVADLQRQFRQHAPVANWLDRFKGSFKDEPAFDEVVRYGREIRDSALIIEDWTV